MPQDVTASRWLVRIDRRAEDTALRSVLSRARRVPRFRPNVFGSNFLRTTGGGTDNNRGTLHTPAETGVDGAYTARTATKAYRTTPLRALWQHAPYFHDGSAATLADVVAHYNRVRTLGLTAEQQRDLVEYLKSL
jgi:cytochrome c peroxidase